MIDLHLHSTHSDGTDSCQTLLDEIVLRGIKLFALTDHDIIDGAFEMRQLLSEMQSPPGLVCGVEISSIFEGREIHLLCYRFDPADKHITSLIAEGRDNRKRKLSIILDELHRRFGIDLDTADVDRLSQINLFGKPHIAKILVRDGIVASMGQAFERFLNHCKTPDLKLDGARVIEAAHSAGGIVCLAHPIEIVNEYDLADFELERFCGRLVDVGLDAIEAFHSSQSAFDSAKYLRIASKYQLKVSGGSDYHGSTRQARLGQLNQENTPINPQELTITSLF